ncbi:MULTISPECIES: alpha/beta fold hydrolase [Burkholderiaceae]|uniref:alpha/beta fold hydrolase n=1 Tax=Burkholderiaceae TaxID=119060 RepID=UPI00095CC62F|nr:MULTISPECIES: alpha/beta hydrolase [Burkholderiaceae]MCG1018874.1 alpha/beta hydrolase [Mycetohabitans sp. B4]SIT74454.1 Pimeloyl-ACP methyl ester carboxylesterase [Burkholderia sp. b13]
MKSVIHFSHANGFPASTYRTIFAELADDYDVRFIERYGHDPRYPVTHDWPHLVDQLLDDVAARLEQPVWLVGHSLGGYLSVMAALKKPHWVKGVVMLDSLLIAGWRSRLLGVTQWAGLDERLSPAVLTRKRRTHWPSRDEAWRHFKRKQAFARWDKRMFADYIDHGIPPLGLGGTRALAFDRDIEYRIYRTLPCTLGAHLAHGAPVPVGFVAGTHSREVRQVGLDATRRIVGPHFDWIDGSHLFPMERPFDTARAIRRLLRDLERGA